MEVEYLLELIEFAVNRILEDIKNNKYSAYKVANYLGTSQNTILNLMNKGISNARKSTIDGLLQFYEEQYGIISLPKKEDDSSKMTI